jgi:hypothetical protein
VSNRDWLKLTPDLTTRWATGNDNFVYSFLWDYKSSFTCRKILRHGTFPLYFPSERKVCCGFLPPLKIHRLCRVLNPQPLDPVASTLTTTPPRRLYIDNPPTFSTNFIGFHHTRIDLTCLHRWSPNFIHHAPQYNKPIY